MQVKISVEIKSHLVPVPHNFIFFLFLVIRAGHHDRYVATAFTPS